MIKKTAQIDAILLDLNKSIDAHYQWLVKMFRCVVAKDISHPELSDAHSHFLCRFGQWLNAHLVMTEEEIEYVRLISLAHEEMHLQGRELLTSIAEKRWQSTDCDRFQNTLLSFTSAVMDYKIYLLNIRSNMDILTGLPGRRVLDESFDRQLLNAEPDKFYLLLLDIDRFKSVNDTLGHLIGDVVLRTLAENLATWMRHNESVYRYGGEEFVIMIKASTDVDACMAGLRICELIAGNQIAYPQGELHITATAGISRAKPGETLDVVMGRADRAMYQGKLTGRNRCMFMDENEQIRHVAAAATELDNPCLTVI
ncbi:diguanylate cyclase [Escherichia fergusonii]|nr:diguanylate cyclase [Escherichia fergusonii]